MKPKIQQISKNSSALIMADRSVYTLSSVDDFSINDFVFQTLKSNWEQMPNTVGGFRYVSFGHNDSLPTQIREVMDENNLAPGIIERQMGLLFGQGVLLNSLSYDGGVPTRVWVEDAEIMEWLASWDYISFVKAALVDYLYLHGFFNSVHLERGHRIGGRRRIAELKHIAPKNARLEWTDTKREEDIEHILVGDFENQCLGSGVRSYPVYDRRNPGKYPVCAAYNHTYSYCRDFYSVPSYWGTLRWIIRGSDVPAIFKHLTDNGFNAAYHVHSPKAYWDSVRDKLMIMYPSVDEAGIDEKLSEYREKILKQLTDVLSGAKNAGKFFESVDIVDPMSGQPMPWKVEPIDQKLRDFVESQIKISEGATSAITSGMGLHPSLSNVMVNGKLASGSEMLYAYKLFLLSDTEIASNVVLEPINQAIAFNFPNKKLSLAFYHQTLKSEEDISTANRLKNN